MGFLERDHTADFNPVKPYLSIVCGIKVFAVDTDVFFDIEFKLTHLSLFGAAVRGPSMFLSYH